VYELGTFADRRPYFTMKLVRGRTLSSLLAERPSPAHDMPRFLAIFEAICQTVAYSHARGVIHRDLKPSNVMVGSFGEVQVMDWGLAKVLKESGIADQSPDGPAPEESLVATVRSGSNLEDSQAGSVLGTPAYMAPEQAAGLVQRVDRRADVFGLGSILCEILTGRPAYTGHGAVEILRKAMRGETAAALARLDGCGAEAELIALAKDCLAVEPENRPRDAGLIAKRITAYLAGVQERVQAAERERAVAVARAIEERRRRKVQLALAASILALTTLGGLSTTYYLQQRAERTRLRVERDAATERVVARAETLRDLARANSDDISRWQVALTAVEQAEADRDEGAAPRLLAVSTEVRAGLEAAQRDRSLLDRLFDIRSAKVDVPDVSITDRAYADAFREAELDLAHLPPAEAGARIKARPASVALALAAALDDWAAVRQGRSVNSTAAANLRGVARIADPDPWRNKLRSTFEQSDEKVRLTELQALAKTAKFQELGPISLLLLGTGLFHAGDGSGAESVLRTAQAQHPSDVWLNYELGNVLGHQRDEAIRFYTAAQAIRPEIGHELAHVLDYRGKSDEALAVFRHLKEVRPGNEGNLGCLGDLLKRKGLTQEAGEAFEAAAVAGREAVRLKPDAAAAHASLARALMRQGKHDLALAELRTMKRLEPSYNFTWPGSVSGGLLQVRAGLNFREYNTDLAILYVQHNQAHELEQSNPHEAEPLYREALEGYRKIQGPDGMTVELTNDLAKLLLRTGRRAEAVSLVRDAYGLEDPRVLDFTHLLAHALEASEPGQAEPLFRKLLEGYRRTEGPDGALTIDVTGDLASLLGGTDRGALAEPLFRDAVERARKRFGPADRRTAGILARFGQSLV
jgi:serine/threonine-protein kinase